MSFQDHIMSLHRYPSYPWHYETLALTRSHYVTKISLLKEISWQDDFMSENLKEM